MGNTSQGLLLRKGDEGESMTAAYNGAWTDSGLVPQEGGSPACASGVQLAGTQHGTHPPGQILNGKTLISVTYFSLLTIVYSSISKWPCHQADPCQGNPSNTNQEIHPGRIDLSAY